MGACTLSNVLIDATFSSFISSVVLFCPNVNYFVVEENDCYYYYIIIKYIQICWRLVEACLDDIIETIIESGFNPTDMCEALFLCP